MATKKTKTKTTLRKFPKAGTIGHMVLTALAKNPDLKTKDILPKILKKFPESKFNEAHMAWYKHQVRRKNFILPKVEAAPKKPKRAKKQAKAEAEVATVEAVQQDGQSMQA